MVITSPWDDCKVPNSAQSSSVNNNAQDKPVEDTGGDEKEKEKELEKEQREEEVDIKEQKDENEDYDDNDDDDGDDDADAGYEDDLGLGLSSETVIAEVRSERHEKQLAKYV